MVLRRCTKTGCQAPAQATLTYVYAEQTAVLGPLAPEHIPGSYDLCVEHCDQLSAPRGWEVIRLARTPTGNDAPMAADAVPATPGAEQGDDLLALADAVREVGLRPDELPAPQERGAEVVVLAERRHLRAVADLDPSD